MEDEKAMRVKPVTTDEQYRLIMECRSSGLTDYQWCLEHNIKPGTFYNWVKRLRQKGGLDIPFAVHGRNPMKQEIVKINFQEPLTPRLEAEAISESIPYSASVLSEIPVIELFMSVQRPVSVLWEKMRQNQGASPGGGRIFTSL